MNEDEILMGATQIAHKVQKKVLVKKKNVKATGKHRSNKFLVVVECVSVDYNYACYKKKLCKCKHELIKFW